MQLNYSEEELEVGIDFIILTNFSSWSLLLLPRRASFSDSYFFVCLCCLDWRLFCQNVLSNAVTVVDSFLNCFQSIALLSCARFVSMLFKVLNHCSSASYGSCDCSMQKKDWKLEVMRTILVLLTAIKFLRTCIK